MNDMPMTELVQRAVLAMPMAQTLGLVFRHIAPGEAEVELPVQAPFCFRPGQLQATAVFAAADFAAMSAAGTLLAPGSVNATLDATLKLVPAVVRACSPGAVTPAAAHVARRVYAVCARPETLLHAPRTARNL